jgi:hypothetical protein
MPISSFMGGWEQWSAGGRARTASRIEADVDYHRYGCYSDFYTAQRASTGLPAAVLKTRNRKHGEKCELSDSADKQRNVKLDITYLS